MGTHVVMMSWKSHMPRRDAATPRTADETMCVIGEVTLMESRLAMLMRKPKTPCGEDRVGQRRSPHTVSFRPLVPAVTGHRAP